MKVLRALTPSPVLSVAVLLLWLMLARTPDAAQLLVGVMLALLVPRLGSALRPPDTRLRKPLRALRYLLIVIHDVVVSNLEVAWGVLRRRGRGAPAAAFVVIPLELRNPVALAVLSMVTTIVPGTVWSELALDRSAMLLHVWNVPDEAAFVANFKARYEQPLREIFE